MSQDSGRIDLPLRGDLDDRPRQMVCDEHGKSAVTTWQVIERLQHHTKISLSPITGRTHQLRVHCAHHRGLAMPILGDDLYGTNYKRLHLHAQWIEFDHPIDKRLMTFTVDEEF